MFKLGLEKIIKNRLVFYRFMYIALVVLAIFTRSLHLEIRVNYMIVFCVVLLTLMISETAVYNLFQEEAISIFCYIELFVLLVMEYFCELDSYFAPALILLSMMKSIEFILHNNIYDQLSVATKKIVTCVTIFAFALVSFPQRGDSSWICYMFLRAITIGIIIYATDYCLEIVKEYNSQINDMIITISDFESDNEKLKEYQDRVKEINEQINYQKIELTTAYNELEQANMETKAQTEIMKYMAATFDISKCINVIADTIMNVKAPKLCAIYISKGTYLNPYEDCVINTNYASMQRRLKKDIDGIFNEFKEKNNSVVIYDELGVRRFRFIGETNINKMAILPFIDDGKIYGIMIIAADKEDFFSKGTDFYENSIIEFNASIKNAKLYYKMQDIARKDGLTGIYNRLYFNELYEKAAQIAVEKNQNLSVALYDIDKFKNVNDTYGHLAGDQAIKMVARVGKKYADKYDGIICRYGGEEFLMVFPDKDENDTLYILEQMHEEIKTTKVVYEEVEIDINVSIGLSSYPNICKDTGILVSRADASMYYGKKNGRGRLVLDNPKVDEVLS